RKVAHRDEELPELITGVVVVEALSGGLQSLLVPHLRVAPMHAQHRQPVGGRLPDRRDARSRGLRLIDDDVAESRFALERQRRSAMPLAEPGRMPELDRHTVAFEAPAQLAQMIVA